MKLSVEEDYTIELKEVFNPIKLTTESGEVLYICMRDSGFEIQYQHPGYLGTKRISANEGIVTVTQHST